MISKITLQNFFSFRHPTTIELNPDVNILVGINGSGKSNFLKAIHLLTESIVGNGLEKIFLKDWGGFHSVINFNQKQQDYIRLSFEFDKNVINAMSKGGFSFPNNPICSIRQPASYGTETKLLPDGQNLMTILNNIKNNHPFNYDQIEEAIRKINPYF